MAQDPKSLTKDIKSVGSSVTRLLDPSEVYERHVRGRRTVYLDNNVWIALTDQKTAVAAECLEVCRLAVSSKIALFPVSYASVMELLGQPLNAPRKNQSSLMDELSEGVSFRAAAPVERVEVRSAFSFFIGDSFEPPSKVELFTYIIDSVADNCLEVPDSFKEQDAQNLVGHLRTHAGIRSVSWLLEHLDVDALRSRHLAMGDRFVSLMSRSIRESSEHFRLGSKPDTKGMLREEYYYLFTKKILPLFRELMLERWSPEELVVELPRRMEKFTECNGKGGPEQLARLISKMPSINLFAQMMQARSMDSKRQVRRQDFWDIEHARVSGAYADAFVTCDRNLVDLLESRCQVPVEKNCLIVRKLRDLVTLLKGWCG